MEREGGGPHGCAAWASGWGEDKFGVWAELRVEVTAGGGESTTPPKSVVQRMRWIPPGEYWMGSGEDDEEADGDDTPRHEVRLTRGFWLGETPVTQGFFTAVMGDNPSFFTEKSDSEHRPVETVDWYTACEFAARLEARVANLRGREGVGQDGLGFRLPTVAEWEVACRSGTPTPRYGRLEAVAWYDKTSGGETRPVGQKEPSRWGLYDMLGNVYEWCADRDADAYAVNPRIDPVSSVGPTRQVRGGSWDSGAQLVRAACRLWIKPGNRGNVLGFRLARGPALPGGKDV